MIAKQISGRTDDACAKRYREALDPAIKQGEWTEEEDHRLLEEYRRWGGRWASVAAQLGRSGLGCRNRWRLLERKKNSHASRDQRSLSAAAADLEAFGDKHGQLSPVVFKIENSDETLTQARLETRFASPSPRQFDQFNELLTHFQTQPVLQQHSSFASTSQLSTDIDIPIDPSLASMLDNTNEGPFQFDARLWDIMNGGCGCGCGSNNVGCSCGGDTVEPPFLDIPTESFLDPFHQLSHTYSSLEGAPINALAPTIGGGPVTITSQLVTSHHPPPPTTQQPINPVK